MDWTLTTERTAWELAAVAATLVVCGVGASAFLKTSKIVAFFRFGVLAALATLFIDPILTRRVEEKPTVVLTLDDSASARRPLGGVGNGDEATVWTRCVELAKSAEDAALRRGFPVERRTLSGREIASFEEELPAPTAKTSPLREAASGLLGRSNDETASANGERERILLFSDGIQNGGVESAERSEKASGVAVDAVAAGVSTGALDWRWAAVDASSTVYPGGDATLRAELRLENGVAETSSPQGDSGNGGRRRAVVRLWETSDVSAENDGNAPTAKLVWERVVDVETDANGNGALRLERNWKPERIGGFDYFLFVADIGDSEKIDADFVENLDDLNVFDFNEFCLFNNAARFRVEAKAEKLDVLLIDDEPRYEYRYLRELLRREEGVALKTLLFSADAAARDGDETAFAWRDFTRRRLAEFDAILVGSVPFKRWNGKAQTLVDVATRDGSETSIWLLRTTESTEKQESSESLATLLFPSLFDGEKEGETTADDGWRLAPTSRGRALFADLESFWTTLETDETGSGVEFLSVSESLLAGIGTETLFNARRRSDGRETPLFVVATLGKNKILAQGTDELWRLRTFGDKTVYRRFVLRALEFLTDGGDAVRAAFANVSATNGGASEAEGDGATFDFSAVKKKIKDAEKTRAELALETQDVAARIDVLREIATATGGEALDLRDLDLEAERATSTAFFERRFGEYPPVVVERSRRIAPRDALFIGVFLCWSAAWFFERRLDERRKNDSMKRREDKKSAA
ncbi:MAG: hypothetical protein IKU86_02135 [Thermoguttaceae bacterium]|nr:hypothetical protein [Thermoguttaceae bacterium]